MSNDPSTAPQADLANPDEIIRSEVWSASGRLSVLSYWAHTFILMLAFSIVMSILAFVVGSAVGGFEQVMSGAAPDGVGFIIGLVIGIPVFLAMMWVSWCMLIKRLHDRNHNGWLSLLFLIPVVNFIFGLYAMFVPGHKTSNRYGAPRPTKGWEKILGILCIVFILLSVVFSILGPILSVGAGM